jgi:hypothetical protein
MAHAIPKDPLAHLRAQQLKAANTHVFKPGHVMCPTAEQKAELIKQSKRNKSVAYYLGIAYGGFNSELYG